MPKKDLLPIGHFARMCQVTQKTLRHYDELELIKPAYVDGASGYRYYSLAQATEIERIRQLRSFEMPLDEIRHALTANEPSAMRKALEDHRRRIEARLEEGRRTLSALDTLINSEEAIMGLDVNLKQVEEQPVLMIRSRNSSIRELGNTIQRSMTRLYRYIGELGTSPAGPPFTIYFDDDIDKADDLELGVCVPVNREFSGEGEIMGARLPGGTVACALHAGPFEDLPTAYPRLFSWIEMNGYQIAGPAREAYLLHSENRTEIMLPVRKQHEIRT